jgi:hypothetical protein
MHGGPICCRLTLLAVLTLAAICLADDAFAGDGNYVFDGGTPAEKAQVRAALGASSFNWSLVPVQITIHIARNIPSSQATPGQIWLDAGLLDSGAFSWGFVQHEYGHQVDFFLLDDAMRATLEQALHGQDWFYDEPLPHAAYGCERFASALAWAYWQSPENALSPARAGAESGGMPAAQFRSLLSALLRTPATSAVPVGQIANAPLVKRTLRVPSARGRR